MPSAGDQNSVTVGVVIRYLAAVSLLVLGVVHSLFAGANFDIGEPVEGAFAAIAGISLFIGLVLTMNRRYERAAVTILIGTTCLTLWFVVTVPQGRSTVSLLYVSLPTPAAAALFLLLRRVRRKIEEG